MRNRRGNVTILMAAMMPLLVVLFAFVVDAGHLLLARTRLQVAADRAAYAGAASLAYDLNRIAGLNWELKQKFDEVLRHFEEDSEAPGGGREELARGAAFQTGREDEMRDIASAMLDRAKAHAARVFAANAPSGEVRFPIAEAGDFVDCFEDYETGEPLKGRLEYDEVTGGVIFDPVEEREAAGGGELVRYCNKGLDAKVALGVEARLPIRPPLMPDLFGETEVWTVSAAQPYGGSIKDFAMVGADSLDEALESNESLYSTAFVPAVSILDLIDPGEAKEELWLDSLH